MADLKLDSHKLIYHPERVAEWLREGDIYPIEIEISPAGACNHRCTFCAVDYVGYRSNFLQKELILPTIRFLAEHGLKSVICSGEGEPLLNKDLPEIVHTIKSYGVDVAMSSNGVLLTREIVDACLADFTWIRFSIASMEETAYAKIHRTRPEDLARVRENIAYAVSYKNKNGLKTTLGVQCILIQDNLHSILEQARELREIGVDYFTVKPYSQHLHSKNKMEVDYEALLSIEEPLKALETETFKIYFRATAMKKMHHEKPYKDCLGLPFMTHIDATGEIWPCIAHLGTEGMSYGNINEHSFAEIWNGEERQTVIERIRRAGVNRICRDACRLDEINKYLHELKHPSEHVNFI